LARQVSQAQLGAREQQAVLQRPELLLRARLEQRAALWEQQAQPRALHSQALEFLLQRQVRAQEAQQLAASQWQRLAAQRPAQVLRRLVVPQQVRVSLLLRRHPSRLFLKSQRLLRQLRLALIVESAF
jgi:hypothetical protein